MADSRIDLDRLVPADKGRTCWNYRTWREEGPYAIDPYDLKHGGYMKRAILCEQPADPRDDEGEPNELHLDWLSAYTIRAYPLGGRTNARSN